MAKKKAAAKPRAYDATSRKLKSDAAAQEIIETLVALLVKSKGADVSFKEISAKSKIPLRTIFRLFKDKEALHAATENYLGQIMTASVGELAKQDFISFATNTFGVYDRNEGLVLAYLFSPFGRQARDILRQKFNRLLLDQISKEHSIKPTSENQAKLALIVSLVNAKLWYDMKTDFGFSGLKIGSLVGWAVSALLKDLRTA
jgi:AcrR family transcriptional regulator